MENANFYCFSRLLPASLFEGFIDVGHYVKELDVYTILVDNFNNLPVSTLSIRSSFTPPSLSSVRSKFVQKRL